MRVVVLLAVACGCYAPHPVPGAPCGADDACPTDLVCRGGLCVSGGGPDLDACPATACSNDELVDCLGAHPCVDGCAASDPPRCKLLAPSNGISRDLLAGATGGLSVSDLVFDTDDGSIMDGQGGTVRAAGSGVSDGIGFYVLDGMGVFTARDFAISGTWTAHGGNAVVMFSATMISVTGTLDVGGDHELAGPAGRAGGIGSPPPSPCFGGDGRYKSSLAVGAGGGGGGGGNKGGDGAATAADVGGATAGGAGGTFCTEPSPFPLRGANGGGAGGTENMIIRGGPGGGGGGAAALVAMTSIVISGTVASPGGGGTTDKSSTGGGGGGAGGVVFLEAPEITVNGALTANGGGGGAGTNAGGVAVRGERGHLDDAVPATGAPQGGNGGAKMIDATSGQTSAAGGGGGGGGATGRVHVKSRTANLNAATLSPGAVRTIAVFD